MAKAPGNVIDFDGSGQVWFKIFQITARTDPTGATYPTYPTLGTPSPSFHSLIIAFYRLAKRHFHYSKEPSNWTVSIIHHNLFDHVKRTILDIFCALSI